MDPALEEISRDGTTVKLEPGTMRALVCLAEHADEVVSVNQLLDTAWKDPVVSGVDTDSSYRSARTGRRRIRKR